MEAKVNDDDGKKNLVVVIVVITIIVLLIILVIFICTCVKDSEGASVFQRIMAKFRGNRRSRESGKDFELQADYKKSPGKEVKFNLQLNLVFRK